MKVAYLQQTVVIHTKYCSCDQIKKNLISGSCDTYWGDMSSMQGFGRETVRKETIGKKVVVDGRINMKVDFKETGYKSMN
jgi:hypothetical protein